MKHDDDNEGEINSCIREVRDELREGRDAKKDGGKQDLGILAAPSELLLAILNAPYALLIHNPRASRYLSHQFAQFSSLLKIDRAP